MNFAVADGLATIQLNRSQTGNAINMEMAEDLAETTTHAAEHPTYGRC